MTDRIGTGARIPALIKLFAPIFEVLLAAGVPLGPNGLITIRGRKSGLSRTTGVAIISVSGRRWVWCPWGGAPVGAQPAGCRPRDHHRAPPEGRSHS